MDRLRRDRSFGECKQSSGDSADAAGDGEAEPVDAFNVYTDGLCPQDGIAASAHGITEGRKQETSQQENADRGERECEQEVNPRLIEWRPRPDADHTVGSAGQCFPLEHEGPDDLSESERQHCEIDAGKPHGNRRHVRTNACPRGP